MTITEAIDIIHQRVLDGEFKPGFHGECLEAIKEKIKGIPFNQGFIDRILIIEKAIGLKATLRKGNDKVLFLINEKTKKIVNKFKNWQEARDKYEIRYRDSGGNLIKERNYPPGHYFHESYEDYKIGDSIS